MGPEAVGGREGGAKVKAGPPGPECLGEGSSYTHRDPPMVRGPAAMGETLGRWQGWGEKEWKGMQPVLSLST